MTRFLSFALALLVSLPASAQVSQSRRSVLSSNGTVEMDVSGMGTASITLQGTWSGTANFEVRGDPNSDAVAVSCSVPTTGATASTATAAGVWVCNVAGLTRLQVRMSSYVSGSMQVYMQAGAGGGGGGSAAATGSVSIAQGGNTMLVNGSGQASVTCANCSGSGVSINEDVASADGQAGTPAYTVRNNTLTGATSADGDYQPVKSTAAGATYTAPTFGDTVAATGNGTANAQTQRVTLASDSTGTLAATQSGTWNVNNVSGTISLPTGAATSANQSTEITALQLIDNLPNTIGSTTSGQSGVLAMGAVTTAAPTYTTAQTSPFSLDTSGSLRVAITNGSVGDTELPAAAPLADNTANPTVPGVGSYNMCWDGSTWDRCPASDGGTGASSANTTRTVEASDSPITTALQLIDDDQTGATPSGVTSAATTNSTNLKASAGRLMGMYLTNTTTTTYYIRFYNLAAAPTCSSATGYVFSMAVPPAGAAGQAGGFSMPFGPTGLAFGTGIGYCITGGGTSTDNTSAATGIFGVIATK